MDQRGDIFPETGGSGEPILLYSDGQYVGKRLLVEVHID